MAQVPSDGSTDISNATGTSISGPTIPGQRPAWDGQTSSPQSGPFTGLVTALKAVTAPQPAVQVRAAPPPGGRILAICGWAALLDLAGVSVGAWGLFALLGGHAAGWYLPSLLFSGAAGIGLTVAAFLSVRQRLTPWILLGGGTLALVCSAVLTGAAT